MIETSDTLVLNQLEREEAHRATAQAASWAALSLAMEKGDVDKVPVARAIIKRAYQPLYEELKTLLDNKATRGPALDWYRKLGASTIAVMFLRQITAAAMVDQENTIQRICVKLGRAIMHEVRVREAEKVNPLYMQRAQEHLRSKNVLSESHTLRTMLRAATVVMQEDVHVEASDAIQVGKWALDAAIRAGLVEQRKAFAGVKSIVTYNLIPELEDVLLRDPRADALSGVETLMIAKPQPWGRAGIPGGYYLPSKNPLGNKHHPDDRKASRTALEACEPLMACLNTLQSTPLEIEPRGLGIVRAAWADKSGGALGVPNVNPTPSPRFPFPETWAKGQASEAELSIFRDWCSDQAAWVTAERHRKADVRRMGTMLREATAVQGAPVYAPTFADWRTRVYYRGTPNPQGPDYSKALLRFHNAVELGDRGLFWLKVHIANSLGYDKTRMADRAAWVDQNLDTLAAGMHAPYNADVYRECTDYPILAAVAVQELVAALESNNPAEYRSSLPIHMDATCSGLQHFSALLRDANGGRYVNLTDEGQPRKMDVYQRVLDLLKVRLADKLSTPDRVLAELWLEAELDRDATKKPTMTYVYGATPRGVQAHYRAWLAGKGWEVSGVSPYAMADFLSRLVFEALAEAVPAADACMRWIRQAAKTAERGSPMRWKTPIGALIEQTYRDADRVNVNIRSCGVQRAIVLRDLDTMRSTKMQAGSAPNFVHSLDAAHLVSTVNAMSDEGHDMVTIHDSFGCHAANVDTMHRVIRRTFVDMYETFDPLQSIVELNGIDLALPERGRLDLSQVLKSEFFFS